MLEKYLTPDELVRLKARSDVLGAERIRETIEKDWPELVKAIGEELARGTDPADPTPQALARRWRALTEEATGGDPALSAGLYALFEHDADAFAREKVGNLGQEAVDRLARCTRYIVKAMKATPVS